MESRPSEQTDTTTVGKDLDAGPGKNTLWMSLPYAPPNRLLPVRTFRGLYCEAYGEVFAARVVASPSRQPSRRQKPIGAMRLIWGISILTGTLATGVADDTKPLTRKELADLLGPSLRSSLRWSRMEGPDFSVYYGVSPHRASSGVGFYVGNAPSFEPDSGSSKHPDMLGTFKVTWHRKRLNDGSLYQTALIPFPNGSAIHVWVRGSDESTLATLTKQLAALPRFNQVAPPPPATPKSK